MFSFENSFLFLFGRAPRLPQQFFHPSLRTNAVSEAKPRRHCERSEAISKEFPLLPQEIASGFAHRNDVDCFGLRPSQ